MRRLVVLLALALSACATDPEEMVPAQPSAIPYSNYTCDQIITELRRTRGEANVLWMSLKGKADGDIADTVLGLVFWPALLLLEGGDGPQAARYQQVKGEAMMLERLGIEKKCKGISESAGSSPAKMPTIRVTLVQREMMPLEQDIFKMAKDCETVRKTDSGECKSPEKEYRRRETGLYNRCMNAKSAGILPLHCQMQAEANTKAFKEYVRKQLRTEEQLPMPAIDETIPHLGR